jgi:hypothetical protein
MPCFLTRFYGTNLRFGSVCCWNFSPWACIVKFITAAINYVA